MTEVLNALFLALITAAIGWAVKSLVPFLKTKTSQSMWELIDVSARLLVEAAEQKFSYKEKSGEEKKAYVMEALASQVITESTDLTIVDAIVEGHVSYMNSAMYAAPFGDE